MTRLIDADALIPIMRYTTTDNEIGVFPIRIGFGTIKGVIDEAPTIDAVEVVRCKDCFMTKERDKYTGNLWCCRHRELVDDMYYCADGLRKGGDSE